MATNIPPHNIDELVERLPASDQGAGRARRDAARLRPGPGFPDRRHHASSRARRSRRPTAPGAASFRLRARWAVEDLGRGTWQIVVTEIPYQVQKGKLIERLAELINPRRCPILADVRDESAEDIRIVLEPRARTVDPEVLMEMLFRDCDLETRFAMNMNVLIDGRTPQVCYAEGGAARLPRPPPRGAAAPLALPAGEDRRAGSRCSKASRRLPQPRPGDRDHPQRGRAEGGDDGRVRADRRAGRGDPQHAAAQPAPAGGDGDSRRARRADRRARRPGGAARRRGAAMGADRRASCARCARPSARTRPGGARRTELRRRAGGRGGRLSRR